MNLNVFKGLMVIYSNLLLMIFNLLPIYPLDGGRIIKGILHIILGKVKAEKYSNRISFITLILVTFLASIAIYKIENIAIFLIVTFIVNNLKLIRKGIWKRKYDKKYYF